MSKEIRVGNTVHRFPDDATDEEIRQAIAAATPPKSIAEQAKESQFGQNLASSMSQFGSNIVGAVMNPRQTVEGMLGLVGGTMEKLVPGEGELEKYPDAFGQFLVDRYGSLEKFRKTMYEDPVGTLADLSTATGLGAGILKGIAFPARMAGLTRTAGLLEGTARGAGTVSQFTDPNRLAFNVATLPLRPAKIPERLYQSALKPPPGSHS